MYITVIDPSMSNDFIYCQISCNCNTDLEICKELTQMEIPKNDTENYTNDDLNIIIEKGWYFTLIDAGFIIRNDKEILPYSQY